jgi:pSer/pThr/pTyr-binding forkhead associated (FHA) protein
MKTNHIARFEETIQRLVEGTFARLFAGRLRPREVANALAYAMEDHATTGAGGSRLAPNGYWVELNPEDYAALLEQQPGLDNDLAQHLFHLAEDLGYVLPHPPVVHLTPQPLVPLHEVRVNARYDAPEDQVNRAEDGVTRQMTPLGRLEDQDHSLPSRPFLILEGKRHIILVNPTVSLGRSFENDIIVDDVRVSRRHAQLQRRHDRYVIFDLGSMGGTKVNGYPVQECVLEAGDIISLAGVEIIYGEDVPTSEPPPSGTRITPPLRRSSLPETGQLPPVSPDSPET